MKHARTLNMGQQMLYNHGTPCPARAVGVRRRDSAARRLSYRAEASAVRLAGLARRAGWAWRQCSRVSVEGYSGPAVAH
jgi:hypothetical protein